MPQVGRQPLGADQVLPGLTPRTVAVVNLDNLRHNTRILRHAAGSASLMAVLKADAYGHGATRVAGTLEEEGVAHFAVASLTEALELRMSGVTGRILVFCPPRREELDLFEHFGLDMSVTSRAIADGVEREAGQGRALRVHVKVDTGMHRVGVDFTDAGAVVNRLHHVGGIDVAGVWTHLATAQDGRRPFAVEQVRRFGQVLEELDFSPRYVHVANSAAIFSLPEALAFDLPVMVRPGIALYGLLEREADASLHGLKPVMTLRSQIDHIQVLEPGESVSYGLTWTAERPSRIATVAIGYADGYPRSLSNKGKVAVAGGLWPVVGRICMDMMMVDLGLPSEAGGRVDVGDEVVLFGESGPSATAVAGWMHSIPHEICSRIAKRVPRVYVDSTTEIGVARGPAEPDLV